MKLIRQKSMSHYKQGMSKFVSKHQNEYDSFIFNTFFFNKSKLGSLLKEKKSHAPGTKLLILHPVHLYPL